MWVCCDYELRNGIAGYSDSPRHTPHSHAVVSADVVVDVKSAELLADCVSQVLTGFDLASWEMTTKHNLSVPAQRPCVVDELPRSGTVNSRDT